MSSTSKILIIGNSGFKSHGTDGQTVKVRHYLEALTREKKDFTFVDLENGIKHICKIVLQIKKEIKKCDRIVLLTASRGVNFFIPLINWLNKKNKPFILPMIGCNILDKYLLKLSEKDYLKAFQLQKKLKIKRKDVRNISKVSLILAENKNIAALVSNSFPNSHVEILENFRFIEKKYKPHLRVNKNLRLIFLSRICEEKGIMDLIDVANNISKTRNGFSLDIYGKNSLNQSNFKTFLEIVNNSSCINYKGEIEQKKSIDLLSKYDLLVFPTKYKGEGTPGIIGESLIAGTPILCSTFSNSYNILSFGSDSISFDFSNKIDLEEKLIFIYDNKEILLNLSKNCILHSYKFIYEKNKIDFLKFVCGE